MQLDPQFTPRTPARTTSRLLVGLLALFAVLAGLLSMHAMENTMSHAGQAVIGIYDASLDSGDSVNSTVSVVSSAGAAVAAGLIGCAAVGMLCAFGLIALVKRALTARPPSLGEQVIVPRLAGALPAVRTAVKTTPSIFALTVLRT